IGILIGLGLATAAGIVTYVLVSGEILESGRASPLRVSAAVAVAVMASLTVATTVGGAIPLILRRLGLDPALASSIFLTFITDVMGFGGFLLVASLLL